MLRITQNRHASGAKSYYSTADYYSEGQELTGRWRGEGARRLGLSGDVLRSQWDALCDNLHPETGEKLTPRLKSDRTVGYDFNFHVPKSVSLLYATTRDERLLDAFRDAVDGTMHAIEADMSTRVRKGGKNENRRTGNMAWGEFVHFTSRPVDGVPDPHLHAHCFVFNTTFDPQEQTWKAGQFRELNRDAPYYEAVFHSRLSDRLSQLGLPIERTATGWELAGVTRPTIDKFSRRTAQIEEVARDKGVEGVEAKAELGAKTRERKQKALTFSELQAQWRSRLSDQERDVLASLEYKIGGDAAPRDEGAAARAMEFAIDHAFERRSVVPERKLLAIALKQSAGEATIEQIRHQAEQSDLIIGERGGRRMATSREVLSEERAMIDYARKGRGTCKPLGSHEHQFKRDWLNASQKKAVEHILQSRDQVLLVRGSAGVGKTTLLQEAVEAVRENGTEVFAFAPSADASRGTLREAGFKDADTVARLLLDEKLQQKVAGQLILIDEAGLLGSKTMSKVFDLADRLDSRVLLVGDIYQHGSIERGSALRLLEQEAGVTTAEVKEIQRQSGEYKEAVKLLAEGRAAAGFQKLDALGWIQEIPFEDRYRQMAADYLATVAKGESALAISPTHSEGSRITSEIRQALRADGTIGADEREFLQLENAYLTEAQRRDAVNYKSGDVVIFHQNAVGFKRGQRLEVAATENLPLDQAERFQNFHQSTIRLAPGDVVRITNNGYTADGEHRLDNGSFYRIREFDRDGNLILNNGWTVDKDFGHLAYGYVMTSQASQSKTVDRVFIAQASESFPASSREQFYVSASRGRKGTVIYTDDKEALREAVNQSDERLSATELVNGATGRQAVALREQREQMAGETIKKEREGMNYER
jgi:conjugative relaxase-like TrwC/TraI family protein